MFLFFVYVLECTGNGGKVTYYTGYTSNLLKRYRDHSSGVGARYTRGKKLKVVFYWIYGTRKKAMMVERFLKKKRKIKMIAIRNYERKQKLLELEII